MEKRIINYEAMTCGRCGGGGRYSYCTMHGDRCFKCHGSGKQLTKRGARAKTAVEAFRLSVYGRRAADVRAGDLAFLPAGWMRADRWQRVTASGPSEAMSYSNGVAVPQWSIVTGAAGLGCGHDTVIKVWTAEAAEQIFAFAATQPGASVEIKPAAVSA